MKNSNSLYCEVIMEILDTIITGLMIYLISFILIGWISYAIQDITSKKTVQEFNELEATLHKKTVQEFNELEAALHKKTVRELKRELKRFQVPISKKRKNELVKCLVECYSRSI